MSLKCHSLELVLSVTGAREVQAVLSVSYEMIQTGKQDLIRYERNRFFRYFYWHFTIYCRTCMKKSGIKLYSIVPDACSACLAYELDKDGGHAEKFEFEMH